MSKNYKSIIAFLGKEQQKQWDDSSRLREEYPRLFLKFTELSAAAYQKPVDRYGLDSLHVKLAKDDETSRMPTGAKRDDIVQKVFEALKITNPSWEFLYDGHCRWPAVIEAKDDAEKQKVQQEMAELTPDCQLVSRNPYSIVVSVNYERFMGKPF